MYVISIVPFIKNLKFLCTLLDPYGRSPPFTPLGALGSGAFGGLGSPTMGQFNGTWKNLLQCEVELRNFLCTLIKVGFR